MTLSDVASLMAFYVPKTARHPSSFRTGNGDWWPAHELGHLIVAARSDVVRPMFGIDDGLTGRSRDYRIAHEVAAMVVSRKLLLACGRRDLVRDEFANTDEDSIYFGRDRYVQRLIDRRGARRIPRTREGLELMLRAKLARAGIAPVQIPLFVRNSLPLFVRNSLTVTPTA